MKATKLSLTVITFFLLLFSTSMGFAQDEPERPMYVVATTLHWNMDYEDFDMDTWKAVEKEYLDKVTMKNELIMSSSVYLHRFTTDNTELISVQTFGSWDAIDKAGARNAELARLAWPDSIARRNYFQKRNAYYSNDHSDEIYATMNGAKPMAAPTKDVILYLQKSHFAFPKDGSQKEFNALNKDYIENVINKNDLILGYYPSAHAWGTDRTEYLEAYFVDSMENLDKMLAKNGELFEAHWADEEARKEFNKKGDKYFTGKHGDYIYTRVFGLAKN